MARVRSSFRTREAGTLEVSACEKCGRITYKVPEGSWLHWSTLGEGCQSDSAPIGVSKPRQGAKMVPVGLDTPARGLARALVGGQYARPSWEWMGCR